MSTSELTHFERGAADLFRSKPGPVSSDDLQKVLRWIGNEIRDIRKDNPSPAPASGAAPLAISITQPVTNGSIAWQIAYPVVAGTNVISLGATLSSADYQVMYVLYDNSGFLLEQTDPSKISSKSESSYKYYSPGAGFLTFIALVSQ